MRITISRKHPAQQIIEQAPAWLREPRAPTRAAPLRHLRTDPASKWCRRQGYFRDCPPPAGARRMTLGKLHKLGAAKLWPDATTPFRRDQPAASNQPSYGATNDRKARSTRKPRGNYISLGDLLRWGRSSPSEASSVQFRPGTRCIRRTSAVSPVAPSLPNETRRGSINSSL